MEIQIAKILPFLGEIISTAKPSVLPSATNGSEGGKNLTDGIAQTLHGRDSFKPQNQESKQTKQVYGLGGRDDPHVCDYLKIQISLICMGWPDTGDGSLEAEEPTVNSKKLVMYRKQKTRDRKAKARFLTIQKGWKTMVGIRD